MQILKFPLQLALCMSLCTTAVMAEGMSAPDKEHRRGMSYEEYAKYREHMRMQMQKDQPANAEATAGNPGSAAARPDKPQGDSAYGQGYQSRTAPEGRAESGANNRPERPQIERFSRGDMGRR